MISKVCGYCNKNFIAKRETAKWCSVNCSGMAAYYRNKEKCLEYRQKWKTENREVYLKQQRHKAKEQYAKNPEAGRKATAKWRRKNPEKNKKISASSKLKVSYGITLKDYETLEKSQNGVCKICQKPEKGKRLAVDHCHETGKIRGLLCQKCNRALGMFHDDPQLLKKAIKYLKEIEK